MVARFHDAGWKCCWMWSTTIPQRATSTGRRLSFQGIDNATYYRLMPDEKRYYVNDTGTATR